jgi:hypothetical protein
MGSSSLVMGGKWPLRSCGEAFAGKANASQANTISPSKARISPVIVCLAWPNGNPAPKQRSRDEQLQKLDCIGST